MTKEKKCPICKTKFVPSSKHPEQIICTKKCQLKYISPLGGLATINKNRKAGKDHPLWTGGKNAALQRKKLKNRIHPEKSAARYKVYRAIKIGLLKKESCRICKNQKSEAHHDDYSKPLKVKWFCKKHHRLEHKRLGWGYASF